MPIRATVIGRLGRDPESRQAGSSSVVQLNVASDHGWGDRKTTTWVRCSIWGKSGEAAIKQLSRGSGVIVSGELTTRTYQGRDGAERTSVELENANWYHPPSKREDRGQDRGQGQRVDPDAPVHQSPPRPTVVPDEDIPF